MVPCLAGAVFACPVESPPCPAQLSEALPLVCPPRPPLSQIRDSHLLSAPLADPSGSPRASSRAPFGASEGSEGGCCQKAHRSLETPGICLGICPHPRRLSLLCSAPAVKSESSGEPHKPGSYGNPRPHDARHGSSSVPGFGVHVMFGGPCGMKP